MKKIFNLGMMFPMLCAAASDGTDCAGVDGFSNPNAEIMEEIKKEEEERVRNEKKNAAKLQLQKDAYEQEYEAIKLRRDRAINDANATALKARTDENSRYNGGGIDTEEHQKALEKINETRDEAIRKVENEFNKAVNNLKTKNPEGYRRSSRY